MKHSLSLIMLFALFLSSCVNDESTFQNSAENENQLNEYSLESIDSLARKLKFMTFNEHLNYVSQTKSAIPDTPANPSPVEPFSFLGIKIDFEFGRERDLIHSHGECVGFGVCTFEITVDWFDHSSSNNYPNTTFLQKDASNNEYFDILLAEPATGSIPPLPVTNDIISLTDYSKVSEEDLTGFEVSDLYRIRQGNYEINNNIGPYGGYRIYVDNQ